MLIFYSNVFVLFSFHTPQNYILFLYLINIYNKTHVWYILHTLQQMWKQTNKIKCQKINKNTINIIYSVLYP